MYSFCPLCGAGIERRVPQGDAVERDVCSACERIHYHNPRVVVGVVATWQEQVLLCRRAIEPRRGFWTIPAGFLEIGETTQAGARRESREEAGVEPEIDRLLAVYELVHVEQVLLVYTGRLEGPQLAPGVESLDARLFAWADIPWDELAFPTVRWALRYYEEVADQPGYAPHTNPSDERL